MTSTEVSNLLLEHYGDFVETHNDMLMESTSALNVFMDEDYFASYISKLTEGLEESTVRTLMPILNRQRDMYIEEASTILDSPQAIAYAVASFPMLINVYAEPLLSKVVSIFPTDKPTMTIPRLRWVAKVIDHTGAYTEHFFPTATDLIRPNYREDSLGGTSGNIFSILGISRGDFRISQRNFRLYAINTTVDGTPTETIINIPCDARSNILSQNVAIGDRIFEIHGKADFDSGDVRFSATDITPAAAGATSVITFDDAKIKYRIFGNGNGLSVVKSSPRQEIIDVSADIEDSFEVENIEEVIQDWKALYNLDIIAELKSHVKDQIKLNRDFEIADLLESNMPFAATIGQRTDVDLSTFIGTDKLRPATVQDIFKNVIPPILALKERMRRQNNMDVEYLVTGIDTAVILKSLQDWLMKFDGYQGAGGLKATGAGDFSKLEIVESVAVRDDLIHLVTGAPTLGKSSLVEVLYKPLYILVSVDNSIRRTFIKSRTWIGIVRPEGLGTVVLNSYDNYFGSYDDSSFLQIP